MDLNELRARMNKAQDELLELSDYYQTLADIGPYHDAQENYYESRRLFAKAEGVRLGMSYLDEYIREEGLELT